MAEKGDNEKLNGKKLKSALIKKALGYDAKEIIEEYVNEDGEIKLTKKKVTKKSVPPDLTAIKLLLCETETPLTELTEEELEAEKERLIKLLKDAD